MKWKKQMKTEHYVEQLNLRHIWTNLFNVRTLTFFVSFSTSFTFWNLIFLPLEKQKKTVIYSLKPNSTVRNLIREKISPTDKLIFRVPVFNLNVTLFMTLTSFSLALIVSFKLLNLTEPRNNIFHFLLCDGATFLISCLFDSEIFYKTLNCIPFVFVVYHENTFKNCLLLIFIQMKIEWPMLFIVNFFLESIKKV